MLLLERINRTGTTVLMATHDHAIVDSMRRRVIELDLGQRRARRGPRRLRRRALSRAQPGRLAATNRRKSSVRASFIREVLTGLRRNVTHDHRDGAHHGDLARAWSAAACSSCARSTKHPASSTATGSRSRSRSPTDVSDRRRRLQPGPICQGLQADLENTAAGRVGAVSRARQQAYDALQAAVRGPASWPTGAPGRAAGRRCRVKLGDPEAGYRRGRRRKFDRPGRRAQRDRPAGRRRPSCSTSSAACATSTFALALVQADRRAAADLQHRAGRRRSPGAPRSASCGWSARPAGTPSCRSCIEAVVDRRGRRGDRDRSGCWRRKILFIDELLLGDRVEVGVVPPIQVGDIFWVGADPGHDRRRDRRPSPAT